MGNDFKKTKIKGKYRKRIGKIHFASKIMF